MPTYTISGKIVAPDGSPLGGALVSIKQLADLSTGPSIKGIATTPPDGTYIISWSEAVTPASPWDLFVEADDLAGTVVESRLLTDISTSEVVDLILGSGTYLGRSEWERVSTPIDAVLNGYPAHSVTASRLEWVASRSKIYPSLVAAYLQSHRLSDARAVQATTCYACLRNGLPADLPGLLRAGRGAWEDALRKGWRDRVIPLPGDGSQSAQDAEVTTELAALDALVVDNAVHAGATGVNRRQLLDTAGLSETEQRTFTQLWIDNNVTLGQFWSDVGTALGSAKKADLQFTIQATNLVANHVETLAEIQAERGAANISTVADLAAWDEAAWDSLLNGNGAGAGAVEPPPEITGSTLAERRTKYARALTRLVEDAYPTKTLRHRLAAESTAPAHTTELVGFFDNNVDFEITRTNISQWVDANASAFSYAINPAQARTDLEITQRVYRITPRLGRYETAKALLDAGITSAADVAAHTRDEFRQAFSSALPSTHHNPDKLANEIWDRATEIHSSAVAMASVYALAKSGAAPLPVQNLGVHDFSSANNGLDSLDDILGGLDYCACKHCRSVLSPAAYLADLLKFLDDRKASGPFADVLAAVRARRPDIEHILLDCDNTNTVLPQIDLVNELLERKFAGTLDGSSRQTTWSAELLATHPEHVEAGVYANTVPEPGTKLDEHVYPWMLPFSLPWLEIRAYLAHLGTSHAELLHALDDGNGAPSEEQKAAARLGLSNEHWQIIGGTWPHNASTDAREYWGYEAGIGDDGWVGILSGSDPTDGDPGELLRRGDYELDELQTLLDLTFIDPNTYTDPGRIEFQWSETCSLADAEILNLDAAALDRLHRFTRLQRAMQLPPRALNTLIEQVGGGLLNDDFLRGLAVIIDLRERTRLDYDVLATWWSDAIDAQAYASGPASLYHRRFLAPELQAPAGFVPTTDYGVALTGEGDVVLSEAERAIVLAATGLSEGDYELLLTAPGAGVFTAADLGKFRLRFFAELMRAASFTRAFGLSAKDFVTLMRLLDDIGVDPFETPESVRGIADILDCLRRSEVPLAQLAWLLRHDGDSEFGADEAATGRALGDFVRGLRSIAAEVAQLVDPTGEATLLNLSSIPSIADTPGAIDEAKKILANISILSELDQQTFIDTHFGSFTDTTAAKAALVDTTNGQLGGTLGGAVGDAPARYAWVLREFIGNSRRRTLLIDLVAGEFGLEAAAAEALLFDVLSDPDDLQTALAEVLLVEFATPDEIATGLDASTHPAQFKAWTRLHKAATIVSAFGIDAAQIAWYSNHANWVDLDGLPLTGADTPLGADRWIQLLLALEARELFASADGHQRLEAAADMTSAVAVLVEANEWDAADLEALLGAGKLNWATPAILGEPEKLLQLRDIAGVSARTGASLLRLWSWIDPLGSAPAVANEIKAAARARHDDAQWYALAPKVRDPIRAAQRDALVAANLAADPTYKNADALSQDLLIDVAVMPCMKTSRIKQAISSVQLFIHRAFLRLEDNVSFNEEVGDLWAWMKNYRVWEANRKIFLYPENWIEPGLRSDKTPQFVALESTLDQDTLDDYRVERALSGYLESLDTVSNLEIVGVWSDITDGSPPAKDIWVLGRSQNAPHEYFLRHRGNWRDWQPWEAVPVDIEGDNVALVRHADRLFLFWLLVHDATSTPGQDDSKFDAKHISVAWSERTQEGWSRVNVSERSPAFADMAPGDNPERFRLQFWNMTDGIRLLVLRNPGGLVVHPLATFDYDAISKHLELSGYNFDANDPENAAFIDDQGNLQDRRVIALQPSEMFGGQRYLVDPFNVWDSSKEIKFEQGPFEGVLFKKRPGYAIPALVHQADLWDPDTIAGHNFSRFCPVVYDDRRRKYLLEPTQSQVGLGTDGDDVSPAKLGTLDIRDYLECASFTPPTPMRPGSERRVAMQIRDGVQTRSAFAATGVPGQEPEIVQLLGGGALAVQKGFEDGVLTNAMNTNNAIKDYADGNEVDPELFWLKMAPLHHPYVHALIHRLSRNGLPGIYDTLEHPEFMRQQITATPLDQNGLDVNAGIVWGKQAPVEEFDFGYGTTYGVYNWEIFYHVPTLIASKLTTDQRFEEAQDWLHRIFDPIRVVEGETGPEKFWRIKPFYEQATELATDKIEAMLGIGVSAAEQEEAIEAFEAEVAVWRENPFDPHAVARVRPGVYQRALLMQYFDNLIAWADHLFRRDTIESLNEATMLYMLVGELLGERPQEVPAVESTPKSYVELVAEGLDEMANAAITLENWVLTPTKRAKLLECEDRRYPGRRRQSVPVRFWYFCYPPNPELLKYWDIVADRLWKIRHCQNIDGVFRQLPLFQPPIDPALLVAATAAGVDLSSVLGELDSGLPPYRFRYVWGRAQTLTGELRSLGGALLSALEKRDGEELATLRSGQEVALLEAVRQVRIQRVSEAEGALESLRLSRGVIAHRMQHYADLLIADILPGEQDNLDRLEKARNYQIAAQVHRSIAGTLGVLPNLLLGTGGFVDFGGRHLHSALSSVADGFGALSSEQSYQGGKSLTNAQYERRREDWRFQLTSAGQEIERVDQDIATGELRVAIARRELEDHDQQVRNARDVDRYMRTKYTDRQLYDWMMGQLSTLYFQTYQLAFDLAKRAERAYRHELAIRDQSQPIIQYGYWDSLRKGLLAGERLAHDLARLDIGYMDKDVREYELRKSVSLAQLEPEELVRLQETGECDIGIPEWVFDLDHPGHYLRRTRAVRLTIPAVVGPYTSLGATLQLVSHVTRINTDIGPGYAEVQDDDRFVHGYGAGESIATSSAVTDAGLFQLDFKDERYLPFEYAGAVSTWRLRLPDPAVAPQFDYRTISDVVIHIDYTAREGGESFGGVALTAAATSLQAAAPNAGQLMIAVHDAFPNEWEKFLELEPNVTTHALTLPLTEQHFPYFAQRAGFSIDRVDAYLIPARSVVGSTTGMAVGLFDDALAAPPATATGTFNASSYPPAVAASFDLSVSPITAQAWRLEIDTTQTTVPAGFDPNTTGLIDPDTVAGMVLVIHYKLTP